MDAYATNESYSGEFRAAYSSERELISRYEVFLRFVSTQSGLTRWQRVENARTDGMEERIASFKRHKRALNEPWYKGAILQNVVDPDSVSVTGNWIGRFRLVHLYSLQEQKFTKYFQQ